MFDAISILLHVIGNNKIIKPRAMIVCKKYFINMLKIKSDYCQPPSQFIDDLDANSKVYIFLDLLNVIYLSHLEKLGLLFFWFLTEAEKSRYYIVWFFRRRVWRVGGFDL